MVYFAAAVTALFVASVAADYSYAVQGQFGNCQAISGFGLVQGVSTSNGTLTCDYTANDESSSVACVYNNLNGKKIAKQSGKQCPTVSLSTDRSVPAAQLRCYTVCPPSYHTSAKKSYTLISGSLATQNFEDPSQGEQAMTNCNYATPSGTKFTCMFDAKKGKLLSKVSDSQACAGFTADPTKHLSHCFAADSVKPGKATKATRTKST